MSDAQGNLLLDLGYTMDEIQDWSARDAFNAISSKLGTSKSEPAAFRPQHKSQAVGSAYGKNDEAIRMQVAFKGAIELCVAGKIALDQIGTFTKEFNTLLEGSA